MGDISYKSAFGNALAELTALLQERQSLSERLAAINERITKVREGAKGLAALCGESAQEIQSQYPELSNDLIEPDLGLTDAIRRVFDANYRWLAPTEVRDILLAMGFDTGKYTNPMASIHKTLQRLADAGEIEAGTYEGTGKTVYRTMLDEDEDASEIRKREVEEAITKVGMELVNNRSRKKR